MFCYVQYVMQSIIYRVLPAVRCCPDIDTSRKLTSTESPWNTKALGNHLVTSARRDHARSSRFLRPGHWRRPQAQLLQANDRDPVRPTMRRRRFRPAARNDSRAPRCAAPTVRAARWRALHSRTRTLGSVVTDLARADPGTHSAATRLPRPWSRTSTAGENSLLSIAPSGRRL